MSVSLRLSRAFCRTAALRAPVCRSFAPRLFLAKTAPRLATFAQVDTLPHIKVSSDDSVTSPPMGIPDTLKVKLSSGDADVLRGKDLQIVEIIIPSIEGSSVGILPGHEYTVQRMDAGIITLKTPTSTHRYVTAGGFAHINDNGSVDLNCVAAFPLEEIDLALVRQELDAARQMVSSNDAVLRSVAMTDFGAFLRRPPCHTTPCHEALFSRSQ